MKNNSALTFHLDRGIVCLKITCPEDEWAQVSYRTNRHLVCGSRDYFLCFFKKKFAPSLDESLQTIRNCIYPLEM